MSLFRADSDTDYKVNPPLLSTKKFVATPSWWKNDRWIVIRGERRLSINARRSLS